LRLDKEGAADAEEDDLDQPMSSHLGELLVRRGRLDESQLAKALEQQRAEGGAISAHLVRLGYISEDELLATCSGSTGCPWWIRTASRFRRRF
jgi:hypothetical protein